ncbi:hypothetical protein [Nocardia farcinica]|uniref:hypothetical protein n=1 Tax=Nocardia farcinica TaxID=37329 RepID=UPI002453B817|nr:hypothetical protein [Nocardia farcinica]
MSGVNREPAIKRRHPADAIPDKPAPTPAAAAPAPQLTPEPAAVPPLKAPSMTGPAPSVPLAERLIEQHNVRIRPSTKERLARAVDKLRYETGDRSISIASITDQALREFLDRNGC